jgi:hypothetical protein
LLRPDSLIGGRAQSVEYRAIHLLFIVPGLTALAGTQGPARRVARWMVWVMLLQMWGDVVSGRLFSLSEPGHSHVVAAHWALLMVWFVRELAWWWLAAMLMAVLAALWPAGWSLGPRWARRLSGAMRAAVAARSV